MIHALDIVIDRTPTGLFLWKLYVMFLFAAAFWPWKGTQRAEWDE